MGATCLMLVRGDTVPVSLIGSLQEISLASKSTRDPFDTDEVCAVIVKARLVVLYFGILTPWLSARLVLSPYTRHRSAILG